MNWISVSLSFGRTVQINILLFQLKIVPYLYVFIPYKNTFLTMGHSKWLRLFRQNHVNEHYNVSIETIAPYLCVSYNIKIRVYKQSWIFIPINSTPYKWTVDVSILSFLWLGNALQYFIHLFHLLCIKLFPRSEVILTNGKHVLTETWYNNYIMF